MGFDRANMFSGKKTGVQDSHEDLHTSCSVRALPLVIDGLCAAIIPLQE